MKYLCSFSILTFMLQLLIADGNAETVDLFRLGVLAKRGTDTCQKKWLNTARYLSDKIEGARFVLVPLDFPEVKNAVEQHRIDFLLTNPSQYIELEMQFGVERIATLQKLILGIPYTRFGGVVITRRDASIGCLDDLRQKTFIAVAEESFGGWLAVWREMKENGIEPRRDFKKLSFAGTHDAVVYAVLNGNADAGAVRTAILEEMEAEGKIARDDFTVIHPFSETNAHIPFRSSTRLYPEWPFARLKHTADEITRQVTVQLLSMEPDHMAAVTAGCAGWTIPLEYRAVQKCLRDLRIGPYRDYGKVTLYQAIVQHRWWVLAVVCALGSLALLALYVLVLNRRLEQSRHVVENELTRRKQIAEELRDAKKKAEDANVAKSLFLATMSHEIRTPMNAILGASELLGDTGLSADQQEYVRMCRSAGEGLLTIINDILDISKVESGQIELESIGFDLNELIESVSDVMALRAGAKNLDLVCRVAPDVPVLLVGDSVRLRQVLVNLIGNAVKFTEEGEIVVRVGLADQEAALQDGTAAQNSSGDSKVQLIISVSDTGIGIADDKLDMVFDRFTQADASTTRQYGGTGLGLNISRLIVELMGGSVWVESEPGKGSCFYFTAGFDKSLVKQSEKESVKTVLAGLKALVIDDVRQNRIVLLDYLQSWGVACREAESGGAGLGLLRQSAQEGAPYDVVILDCRMPVMDGFMVADIIRKESGLTGAVLMMLSSDHRQGDVQRCRQSGVAAHMLKPVKKTSLKAALMKVLGSIDVDQEISGSHNVPGSTDAVIPVSVLLVEDNEDNRQLINFYLSKTDHRVDIAENGKIAVNKVKANAYDLILMDIQMPVLDGIEATKQIRAWEKQHDALPLPIVALTAGAFKEDREKCFAAGCTAYLSKPVKKKELIDTIAGYSAQNAK